MEMEGGRRRGLTGGADMSATAGKKRRWGRGPLRGRLRWAGGPLGGIGRGEVFSFFPFSFSNSFQINFFFNSNSNKTFQTFSQNFINLLYLTQATKNHA
jgi:hypothetical protein